MSLKITPSWKEFPPEFLQFKDLGEAALSTWAENGSVMLKPLGGGASGAAVFKIDIAPKIKGDSPNGHFVLKLCAPPKWRDQPIETQAHKHAVNYCQQFASKHMPELRAEYPLTKQTVNSGPGLAMLYAIAGASLDTYQTADVRDCSGLLEIADSLMETLLHAWTDSLPGDPVHPHNLLNDWLGYRLDAKKAQNLHTLINRISEEKHSHPTGKRKSWTVWFKPVTRQG